MTKASHGIDWDVFAANVEHDDDAMREVIAIYLETAPRKVASLHAALGVGSVAALELAARGMRGAVAVFGAAEAEALAQSLEDEARRKDWTGAEETLRRLETALARVAEDLKAFKGKLRAAS